MGDPLVDRVCAGATDIHAVAISALTSDVPGLALISSWLVSAQERFYCNLERNESQNQESHDDSNL
jgi:hypothetical protein